MHHSKRYFTGLPSWTELERAEENRKRMWREVESRDPMFAKYRRFTIKAVSSDKFAKESYSRLLKEGVSQPELLEWLVGIAVSLPRRGRVPKWLSGSGMTANQLDNFPSPPGKMAGSIEALNKHPLLRADIWIQARAVSKVWKDHLGLWFMRLPLLLRHYAAFLRAHSRDMSGFLLQANREGPQARALFGLINLVRRETGRPMLNDLSNVLTATATVAGTAQEFDPLSLKVLDSRKRKKRADARLPHSRRCPACWTR